MDIIKSDNKWLLPSNMSRVAVCIVFHHYTMYKRVYAIAMALRIYFHISTRSNGFMSILIIMFNSIEINFFPLKKIIWHSLQAMRTKYTMDYGAAFDKIEWELLF